MSNIPNSNPDPFHPDNLPDDIKQHLEEMGRAFPSGPLGNPNEEEEDDGPTPSQKLDPSYLQGKIYEATLSYVEEMKRQREAIEMAQLNNTMRAVPPPEPLTFEEQLTVFNYDALVHFISLFIEVSGGTPIDVVRLAKKVMELTKDEREACLRIKIKAQYGHQY